MKNSEISEFAEGSFTVNNDLSMTRKRVSTSDEGYPLQSDQDTIIQNKLPKFEFVTQISGPSSSSTHHQNLLSYCDSVDFHNEKGQRIFLTESENAEFVNIMLQDNLLSVQTPMTSTSTSQQQQQQLLELNADLLDLDHKAHNGTTAEEGSNIVTLVHNSDHEIDFENQLVRVEIQDAPPPPFAIRGQTANICSNPNMPREPHHQEQQHNGTFGLRDFQLSKI